MDNSTNIRGYLPIELPFYKFLNWDEDLSILCLEVFRVKLPVWIKELPETAKYDLISFEYRFPPPYPAIGIYCEDEADFKKLPDFWDLFERLEMLTTYGLIEEVLEETKKIEAISWEELKRIGVYTNPVKYKD